MSVDPVAKTIAVPVRFAARHPVQVLTVALLLAVVSAWLAATQLQVSTDVDGLFAADLPWKQREYAFKRLFPQFTDTIVAVIDADSPEAADATAAGLEAALLPDKQHFRTVRRPDASPFFDRNGLLFLDQPVLETLLNQTIDAQPFLGQLAADTTARGLFAALGLVAMGVERGQADLTGFTPALQGFNATLQSALDGRPKPLSWQRLLAGPVADLGGPYRFVLVQPTLDYGAVAPGAAATVALREAGAKLEFVRSGQAHLRVTGSVPLSDEEFAEAAQGAVAGLAGSSLIVIVWLAFAVRSWRLFVPILLTLVLGLLYTTAFATLASNPLNLISVAFAILFVGIAVDFAIQFTVRTREQLAAQAMPDPLPALDAAARRSGLQILVAAAATSAGFLAFVPTSFSGVAELGLVAGVGMLIAFLCSITVLPAALVLLHGRRRVPGEAGFGWAAPLDRAAARARWPIVGLFALLAVFGAAAAPRLQFDSDPLHVKDPGTEAMRTLTDLAANPITDPYTIDVLTTDKAGALDITRRVEHLPLVAQVVSLDSFIPGDQPAKLALIADAASLLAPTLAPREPAAPITPADLRLAAKTAGAQLGKAVPLLPPNQPASAALTDIAHSIDRLAASPDATLLAANDALTRFLPAQLSRLRDALQAAPVDESSIPPEIARDWVLPDGRRRVQISARPEAAGAEGLRRFVDQVRAAVPDAGGSAVSIAETARTIIGAFESAAAGAILAIVVILAIALRRLVDVLMVLAPLVLSSLMTLLIVVLLPMPLNFANVIALPLLLGVGVSFNIYFVMNWRAGQRAPLASPTARAIIFSALTTGTAFGSLALSHHPGTASMGRLLLLSLACTLLASLVFVPAMLAIIRPHGGATSSAARRS